MLLKKHFNQSICRDLDNGNAYAKYYQCKSKDSRDRARFTFFSEFEPRQNLDQSQMTFDNLLGYILSISMCMQNFITLFRSVQAIRPFLLFQNLELGKASTDDICHFAISWAISCQMSIKIFQMIYELSTFFAFCPGTKSSQTVR